MPHQFANPPWTEAQLGMITVPIWRLSSQRKPATSPRVAGERLCLAKGPQVAKRLMGDVASSHKRPYVLKKVVWTEMGSAGFLFDPSVVRNRKSGSPGEQPP